MSYQLHSMVPDLQYTQVHDNWNLVILAFKIPISIPKPRKSLKEYVAVLIGLYRNYGAVTWVRIYFHWIWSLQLVRTWLHHWVWEGSNYTWIPSWVRSDCGQISIETTTHSFDSSSNSNSRIRIAGHQLWPTRQANSYDLYTFINRWQ